MRRFAISDIHGCARTFKKLVLETLQFSREDELYLLGDFVDRGPDSKGVLDFIMNLKTQDYHVHCLMGNHEIMMIESWDNKKESNVWKLNGGVATMESFGTQSVSMIPEVYIDFLRSMEPYLMVEEYIMVHAGLNFRYVPKTKKDFLWKVANPFLDQKSLFWIRDWYQDLDRDWLGERIIIHGHTPKSHIDITDMKEGLDKLPVLDIDNGCFAKFQAGLGALCAYELGSRQLYFEANIE